MICAVTNSMTARLPLGTIFQSAKLIITLKDGVRLTLCLPERPSPRDSPRTSPLLWLAPLTVDACLGREVTARRLELWPRVISPCPV